MECFQSVLTIIIMLPNEFVSVTSIHRNYRTSYRCVCIFDDATKVAHRVLSELAVFCMQRYGKMPYETLQIKTKGGVDVYTYFVTFPLVAHTHYVIRYVVFNDLPF